MGPSPLTKPIPRRGEVPPLCTPLLASLPQTKLPKIRARIFQEFPPDLGHWTQRLVFQKTAFYPRDAMLARVLAVALCLSVCLSVESRWVFARELRSCARVHCVVRKFRHLQK